MEIPKKLIIDSISPKDILVFSNPDISSPDPHLYICVATIEVDIKFVISASKKEKVFRRNAVRGFADETVVYIPSKDMDSDSTMDSESWIDCNNVFSYSREEFETKFGHSFKVLHTQMHQKYFEQIINAVCMSTNVEGEVIDHLNGK